MTLRASSTSEIRDRSLRARIQRAALVEAACLALLSLFAASGCGGERQSGTEPPGESGAKSSGAAAGKPRLSRGDPTPEAAASRKGSTKGPRPVAGCLKKSGVAAVALPPPEGSGVTGAVAVTASHRNVGASALFFGSVAQAERFASTARRTVSSTGDDGPVYRVIGQTVMQYLHEPERQFEDITGACLGGRQAPTLPGIQPSRSGPVKLPETVAGCLEGNGVRGVRTITAGLDPYGKKIGVEAIVVVPSRGNTRTRLYFFERTAQAKRIANPAEAGGLLGTRVGRVVLEFPPQPVGSLEDQVRSCLQ